MPAVEASILPTPVAEPAVDPADYYRQPGDELPTPQAMPQAPVAE
jgi:hypothetical protein